MGRGWSAVVPLVVVLLCCAAPVGARQAEESAAERIARLRDHAAQQEAAPARAEPAEQPKTPAADSGKDSGEAAGANDAANDAGDVVDGEPDKPLPPNENLLLGEGASDSGLFGDASSSGKVGGGKLGDGWLLSTLAALGVVLALVFVLRWLLRRGGVVASSAPQGSVVEVLSRTTVAPRSHVILMRVGQRILIVNDSPNGMRTLATVQDPEEVAELLGAVEASRPTSMSAGFSAVMGRLSSNWSDEDEVAGGTAADDALDDGVTVVQARGAVSSVRGRLAALAGGGVKA